ncbi:MAG TPA: hypothetical protein VD789_11805 [Thermomicrobiales bacterium]|nr:hypothetical protein [Thermomicrobiales bacterium]
MGIPDYHISRIILEEHMRRQFEDDPREDRRRRYDHERPRIATSLRAVLSGAIYRLATAIDPAPTAPALCNTP